MYTEVNENTKMNDAEIKIMLKNFLDEEEKLKAFPAKRKKKLYALIYLSGKLEAEHEYTEREINEVLSNWHTFADPAMLRRELYNYRFLDRSKDGRVYRLAGRQLLPEELGL